MTKRQRLDLIFFSSYPYLLVCQDDEVPYLSSPFRTCLFSEWFFVISRNSNYVSTDRAVTSELENKVFREKITMMTQKYCPKKDGGGLFYWIHFSLISFVWRRMTVLPTLRSASYYESLQISAILHKSPQSSTSLRRYSQVITSLHKSQQASTSLHT